MSDIARRIRVTGRVQGVFFRDWAVAAAAAIGVRGWVRNRRDGSVELLAIGRPHAVAALIAQCHAGPPRADVAAVEPSEAAIEPLTGFARRPTA